MRPLRDAALCHSAGRAAAAHIASGPDQRVLGSGRDQDCGQIVLKHLGLRLIGESTVDHEKADLIDDRLRHRDAGTLQHIKHAVDSHRDLAVVDVCLD